MAHTVEEYHPMTTRQLYDHIRRFASDGERSSDVDVRWLAAKMGALTPLVARVMNGRFEPEERADVNAFRAAELEKEIAEKRRVIERLEGDLKRVQPVKAA